MSFLLSLMISLQQNRRRRGQNKFCLELGWAGVGGEVTQTMYTHVSKCKNDKIKGEKNSYSNDLPRGLDKHILSEISQEKIW
jgi:hypothetical protein